MVGAQAGPPRPVLFLRPRVALESVDLLLASPHPQSFSQKAPPLILPIHRAQGAMGSSHASIPPQVHPVPEGSPSLSGHRPHLSVGTSWVSLGFPPHTLVRPGAAQLAAEPAEDEGGVCMLLEASSLGARQRLRP